MIQDPILLYLKPYPFVTNAYCYLVGKFLTSKLIFRATAFVFVKATAHGVDCGNADVVATLRLHSRTEILSATALRCGLVASVNMSVQRGC